jgi:uncharacterized protein (UPF0276 family)
LTARAVPALGVGVAYQRALAEFLVERDDAYDYLEVVPDTVWVDRGPGRPDRYRDDPEATALLERLAESRPVVAHSIGLSIGSAHAFDREHVAQVRRWCERFRCPWHSDHLSYNRAEHGDGSEVNVGMTLPVAHDEEMLDLLVPRVAEVQAANPRPFALENNVYYVSVAESPLDEPEFLNELSARTGCWLLLDLHNLYVNERNGGMKARAFLDALDLDRVIEVHVAGGGEHGGFYLDSHSGPTPRPVLELLARALGECPNLGGVTYELVGSWYEAMGADGLERELAGLRELWRAARPAPVAAG